MVAELVIGQISAVRTGIQEVQIPQVVQDFKKIFDAELSKDIDRNPEDSKTYYRALVQAFRSEDFRGQRFSNGGVRTLVDFFLTDETLKGPFEELVRTQNLWREQRTLPQSVYRIYSIGKLEILRRNGTGR